MLKIRRGNKIASKRADLIEKRESIKRRVSASWRTYKIKYLARSQSTKNYSKHYPIIVVFLYMYFQIKLPSSCLV